jgi:hypothetical protein
VYVLLLVVFISGFVLVAKILRFHKRWVALSRAELLAALEPEPTNPSRSTIDSNTVSRRGVAINVPKAIFLQKEAT